MLVKFEQNKNDQNTVLMIVDNKIIINDIPYIPEKCIDQRGLNLYIYLKKQGKLNEKYLISTEDNSNNKVLEGFNYMFNPVYVLESIKEFMR